MSNYSVIQMSGKQYRVAAGETLNVNRLEQAEGAKFSTSEVLLTVVDGEVTVGAPFVPNAKVELEVIENIKAKKIRVAKFKSKSRYRKVNGHRQLETVLKIVSIG